MDVSPILVTVYEKYLRDAGFRVVKCLTSATDAISFFSSDAGIIADNIEVGEESSHNSFTVLL
ncbi:MAG: hypothetical protein ACHQ1H_14600, partial [Nitrososphaerales archaeon]